MSTISIITPSEVMKVNDANQITRPAIGMNTGSNDWRLTGAVELKVVYGRLVVIRQFSVDDIRNGVVPWKYKNGKQRCHLTDYDHGSNRVKMSPNHYTMTVRN